jgi:hypothetical protein
MQYCPQCGTAISTQALFCPSCGLEMTLKNTTEDFHNKPFEKMQKGVTKSLENKAQEFVENQFKEKVKEMTKSVHQNTESLDSNKKNTDREFDEVPIVKQSNYAENSTIQTEIKSENNVSYWIWIYLFFNVVLAYFGHRVTEIQFTLLLAVFTIIMVWIQKNNQKPYNWIVKILLLLQMLVFVLLEIRWYEFIFKSPTSIIIAILFFVNFIQLFKGNKN